MAVSETAGELSVAMTAATSGAAGAGADTVAASRSGAGWDPVILQWLQHGIVPCIARIIDLVWQQAAALAGAAAARTISAATNSVARRRVGVEICNATI